MIGPKILMDLYRTDRIWTKIIHLLIYNLDFKLVITLSWVNKFEASFSIHVVRRIHYYSYGLPRYIFCGTKIYLLVAIALQFCNFYTL